jgi:adenylyltransferase/sulfurtransferase
MKEITAKELKKKLDNKENFILLDVRLPFEVKYSKIEGSINVPVKEVDAYLVKMDKSKEIVIYCHSGGRSAFATEYLIKKGFKAKNLIGGIIAYSDVDPKVKKY